MAWLPSGKASVCKTDMSEFDSHPRLMNMTNLAVLIERYKSIYGKVQVVVVDKRVSAGVGVAFVDSNNLFTLAVDSKESRLVAIDLLEEKNLVELKGETAMT